MDFIYQIPDTQVPQLPCSSPFVSGLTLTDVCSGGPASLFLNMLSVLTTYNTVINGACERITPVKKVHKTYDFIVVGGKIINTIIIITCLFIYLDINRDIFVTLFPTRDY